MDGDWAVKQQEAVATTSKCGRHGFCRGVASRVSAVIFWHVQWALVCAHRVDRDSNSASSSHVADVLPEASAVFSPSKSSCPKTSSPSSITGSIMTSADALGDRALSTQHSVLGSSLGNLGWAWRMVGIPNQGRSVAD